MPKSPAALMLFLCLCLLGAMPAAAQDDLLTNPGFEPPYNDVSGTVPQVVADGWTPWTTATDIANQPEFGPASAIAPDRVLMGEDAQILTTYLNTAALSGGLYQTVTGLAPGTPLRFTVNAYVWSSSDATNPGLSVDPASVFVAAGISPSGSTDPQSSDIVWATADEAYDTVVTAAVEAAPLDTVVTAFIRVEINGVTQINEVTFDLASLEVAGDVSAAGSTDTAATDEAAPTEAVPAATNAGSDQGIITLPTSTPEPIVDSPTAEPTVDSGAAETLAAVNAALTQAADVPITLTAAADQAAQLAANNQATADALATSSAQMARDLQATSDANTAANAAATNAQGSADTQATSDALMMLATSNTQATNDALMMLATSMIETATAVVVEPTATGFAGPASTDEAGMLVVGVPFSDNFPNTILHTVQRYDTVAELAMRYDSTTEAIVTANGLDENALIFIGQGLVIPVRIPPPATETPTATPVVIVVTATPGAEAGPAAPIPADGVYIVQPGDTLSTVARRFNTTTRALAQLNGIVNINNILVGQRLVVPTGTEVPTATAAPDQPSIPATYIVQPGDSLYRIAVRFGVDLRRLAEINGVSNYNLIFVGQVLTLR